MSESYKTRGFYNVTETNSPNVGEAVSAFLSDVDLAKDSVPLDVDELTEKNDLTVLKGQLSSDELVSNLDILKTEELISKSRNEEEQSDIVALASPQYTINIWEIVKRSSINIILPFINGIMLGFGEILAHEIGFRYNWTGARVHPPRRMEQRQARNTSKFL